MEQAQSWILPANKKKLWLLLIGAVVFVILGIWMLFGVDTESLGVRLGGLAGILFFGWGAMDLFKQCRTDRPLLVADATGLTHYLFGRIDWKEVTDIRIFEMSTYNQRFLLVDVRDPESVLQRLPALKRRLHQGNVALCGTPVYITPNMTSLSVEEIQQALLPYWQKAQTSGV